MQQPISTTISATEKVLIQPQVEHFDEHAELCAINWFDLKRAWLYTLYGMIASIFVRKVAGKLCFKGTLIKQLEGDENHKRENLLIVCYPDARSFLNLVDFRVFQLVSVFRLAAVKRFCFGFTENILQKTLFASDANNSFSKQQLYLVHHFRGDSTWLRSNLDALLIAARQHQLECYFCGLTTAHIVREKSGQQQSTDFFMDGIVIFAADTKVAVEDFSKDDIYTTFKHNNTENSLYLFNRSL